MNDIEISQNAEMLPIQEIAQQAGFNEKPSNHMGVTRQRLIFLLKTKKLLN